MRILRIRIPNTINQPIKPYLLPGGSVSGPGHRLVRLDSRFSSTHSGPAVQNRHNAFSSVYDPDPDSKGSVHSDQESEYGSRSRGPNQKKEPTAQNRHQCSQQMFRIRMGCELERVRASRLGIRIRPNQEKDKNQKFHVWMSAGAYPEAELLFEGSRRNVWRFLIFCLFFSSKFCIIF